MSFAFLDVVELSPIGFLHVRQNDTTVAALKHKQNYCEFRGEAWILHRLLNLCVQLSYLNPSVFDAWICRTQTWQCRPQI